MRCRFIVKTLHQNYVLLVVCVDSQGWTTKVSPQGGGFFVGLVFFLWRLYLTGKNYATSIQRTCLIYPNFAALGWLTEINKVCFGWDITELQIKSKQSFLFCTSVKCCMWASWGTLKPAFLCKGYTESMFHFSSRKMIDRRRT